MNTLMQQVMAMRSPELMERMPDVEAMPWEERVALVSRGHNNITQLIRGWDKFADLLMAQGWTRQQVKQKAKGLKNARQRLEMGMRLADPKKIPKPFEEQAHAAFDVLAAWFLMDAGALESVLTGRRLSKADVSSVTVAPPPEAPAAPVRTDASDVEESMPEASMVEASMDVSNDASGRSEDALADVASDHYRD